LEIKRTVLGVQHSAKWLQKRDVIFEQVPSSAGVKMPPPWGTKLERKRRVTEREQLEQAIAALETQRASLGDAIVDVSITALRKKLAALPPLSLSDQQRKQVTVLFADISGFTALSEPMDAEDLSELVNALWERLDKVIMKRGGTIDKHVGDKVMALWGVETAREDDPERAIRAALAIQAEARDFDLEAQPDRPHPKWDRRLQMRIGINTGPVFLGPVGTTGEYSAIGDTVNTVSRLEKAAPVGSILISHDTYRHVRGVFDVQPLKPIEVRGKREPLQAYVVERAKPRAFRMGRRGVEGIETRMIGRQAELEQLQGALCTAMEDGGRQMITIIGEAGVGKSRLLYEFENWVELLPETVRYFKGRARLEMQNLPYALIRDLFTFRFQIQDSDRARVVGEKMERGIGEALAEDEGGQMKAHFIGQLLGFDFSDSPHLQEVLDDAKQIHDRALIYFSEFFRATAELSPTVIFLEDVHWADDSSLDVIDHLAQTTPKQRLLIVCLARPFLFERRPGWGEGRAFHTQLELHPLSRQDSRCLVEEILQKVEQAPDVLRELVVSRAEGNPFYVEELIKMLIEDGVILKGEERWRVEPVHLAAARVPSTLTGVLQARLDSLSPQERAVLQLASVVGRTFWTSAVERISASANGGMDENEIQNALSALWGKEMAFRRKTSAFAGTQEYIFKHAIMREVTYESVLKRHRPAYHACVAAWLMEQSAERAGEHSGLIADHLELAGQTELAAVYLRQAGEQAAAKFANAEAVAYFSRALDLTPAAEPGERYGLLLAREKVYHLQGEREAQAQDLAALNELAKALGNERRQAEVALHQAGYGEAIGDYAAAIESAQVAIRLAQVVQDASREAAGYQEWGRALMRRGDHEAALTRLEGALTLAKAAGLRQTEANSLRNLGNIHYFQGDYATAKAYYEQSLRACREIGDRRGEGHTLNNLGLVSDDQGDCAAARAYYEQALCTYLEIGDRWGQGASLNNLGCVSEGQGDYARAKSYFEQALCIKREIGDRQGEALGFMNLAKVFSRQGDYSRSRAYYQQSCHILREIGDQHGESEGLYYLSLLCHHQGDDELARQYGQKALCIAQDIGDRSSQGYALTHLGHALAGLGHLAEAADAYRQALVLRCELGQPHMAMESLAGLARVSLIQEDLTQAQTQVEEILSYLQSNTLAGTEEPFRVYLTCYRVLHANQDPRAQGVLDAAHRLLQERAAKISDEELRRSFLENVTAQREIVSEWRAANST